MKYEKQIISKKYCLNCNKDLEFLGKKKSKRKFCSKHCSSSYNGREYLRGFTANDKKTHICPFCLEIFETNSSFGGHITLCPDNPQKRENPLLHKRSWNKGASKETDVRLKNFACKMSELFSSDLYNGVFTGMARTPEAEIERREKISIAQTKRLEELGGSGFKDVGWYHVKNILGEEYIVRGTWEKRVADELNSLNILWKRKVYLVYKKNGVKHLYSPDFFIPTTKKYLEIKGYFSEEDKEKLKLVSEQNGVKITLLFKKDLENIADMVK
jgi:hypothetical protein